MRVPKPLSNSSKNRPLEEPIYVDEVYPDESVPGEGWSRPSASSPSTSAPEPGLEFLDDEDEEDVEDEPEDETPPLSPRLTITPSPKTPPAAPTPSPRTIRLKSSPPVTARPTPPKSLPTELPRPNWRERPVQPARPRREERTGTWPVQSESKRVSPPPKTSTPIPPASPERTHHPAPKEVPTSQSRPPAPVPWQLPVKPAQPVSPRTTFSSSSGDSSPATPAVPAPIVKPVSTTAPQSEPMIPPPLFTTIPAPNQPPKSVLTPDLTSARSSFQPLVADPVPTTDPEPEDGYEPQSELAWELPAQEALATSLHDLLERIELPQNSLVLGVCADGLPLVLELSDPSPGALLFLGDDVPGLQKHLQAVLASVCLMSDPKQVQVDVISPTPKTFAPQKMYPHVQKVHQPDQDEMYELLGSLFELIEDRQRKDNSLAGKLFKDFLPLNKGPVRILMIDQVDVLVEQLAPESLAYLRWLLRRGPAANVWVLASLNTRNAQTVESKTLKAFGLRIHGKIQNPQTRLTDVPADRLSSLIPGEQACLKLDEELVEFSILD